MTLVGEPDPLSDLGEEIVALLGAADIGQDATDALIVALPKYFAWGMTGHTDGDQPPGSTPLLADKLGDTPKSALGRQLGSYRGTILSQPELIVVSPES